MQKQYKNIAVVGSRDTGKTMQTMREIYKAVSADPMTKAIIFDVRDELGHFTYPFGENGAEPRSIETIELGDIPNFNRTSNNRIKRVVCTGGNNAHAQEIKETAVCILDRFTDGIIFFNDADCYFNVRDFSKIICTRMNRQQLIVSFNSLGALFSSRTINYVDYIRMHKIRGDTVDSINAALIRMANDAYEFLLIASLAVHLKEKVLDKQDFYYLDLQEQKIIGDYTIGDFDAAFGAYIRFEFQNIRRRIGSDEEEMFRIKRTLGIKKKNNLFHWKNLPAIFTYLINHLRDKYLIHYPIKEVQEIVDKAIPLVSHLECDGATRVLNYMLTQAGIDHTVYTGVLQIVENVGTMSTGIAIVNVKKDIKVHYWIKIDKYIIDLKSRMWLGLDAQEGYFIPDEQTKYYGNSIEMKTSKVIFELLTKNDQNVSSKIKYLLS